MQVMNLHQLSIFFSDAEQGNSNEEASKHFVSKGIQQGHVYYINRQKVSGPFCYFNSNDEMYKTKLQGDFFNWPPPEFAVLACKNLI